MTKPVKIETPDIAIGTPLEGGFYAGRIRLPDGDYAVLVAPRTLGEQAAIRWSKSTKRLAGALSFFDGCANTLAMAEAGSPLAQWALGLEMGGHADWYIPSRDELELCYRDLKPSTEKNWCYRGDNPSSVPVGYAYLPDAPAQTAIGAFRTAGAEAFTDDWHWTSTQYAGDGSCAWCQTFSYGGQSHYHATDKLRARAVRRFKL
jgi:hypothetical protein